MSNQNRDALAQRQFILAYLAKHTYTDACDQLFHDEFFLLFGGARHETFWGAQTVYKAQKLLKKMYDEGTLDRGSIGLGANWQPGFPRWVYTYAINRTRE